MPIKSDESVDYTIICSIVCIFMCKNMTYKEEPVVGKGARYPSRVLSPASTQGGREGKAQDPS